MRVSLRKPYLSSRKVSRFEFEEAQLQHDVETEIWLKSGEAQISIQIGIPHTE